ncbi:alpha/beta fold hydrolase [Streptomyces sp. NPDC046939]|uniref:alpha/beta fold hydrolase n=1 Tax=Streptomyces sp. NPDC046939 TaxID=3155376 RepID=UPI0033CC6E1B
MDILHRNNVTVTGDPDGRAVVLAHGFGCDQNMWRLTVPALERDHRVVLFDYVGAGRSDLSAFSEERYGSLDGYARDVVEVCDRLELRDAVFVGHSVSSMTGVLAAQRAPERIGALVMVAPSPRSIDDEGYRAGSARATSRSSLSPWRRTTWAGRRR